jgi:hypothetical protein
LIGAQTISCSSGSSCTAISQTCQSGSYTSTTSTCYFDILVNAESGWNVNSALSVNSGSTSHYVNWGNWAAPNNGANGPFGSASNGWSCSSSTIQRMYLRVYCFAASCGYALTFTTSWAISSCGMTWLPGTTTTCNSNCLFTRTASCYYSAYSTYAPSSSICTTAIGAYSGGSSYCASGAICDNTSICQSNVCVNLCSGNPCNSQGTCHVANSAAYCSCTSCYSGSTCLVAPSGFTWQQSSWSSCNCDGKQTRTLSCVSSSGCAMSSSACGSPPVSSQTCEVPSSCSTNTSTYIIIGGSVGGGLFLAITVFLCRRYGGGSSSHSSSHHNERSKESEMSSPKPPESHPTTVSPSSATTPVRVTVDNGRRAKATSSAAKDNLATDMMKGVATDLATTVFANILLLSFFILSYYSVGGLATLRVGRIACGSKFGA